ncbi:MAG: anhydro-N-acetylmuramic acid kinase [Pseudomonadota bacterium]
MERLRAIGLMSGTSMDGVDGAVVETDGVRIHAFGPSAFRAYEAAEREVLAAAQGLWPGQGNALPPAADVVLRAHEAVVAELPRSDVIGFHGQTVAHDPEQGRTHQIGDGDALSLHAGCPVVWDFRTADMQSGGQGAPLAPVFHHACARWAGLTEPTVFLNLGGVGNVTLVDPGLEDPAVEGAVLAFDTGPANALVDDVVLRRTGEAFDRDGARAAQGTVHGNVLRGLPTGFLRRLPPKSLDRNDFHDLLDAVEQLSTADAVATLTAVTVETVAAAQMHFPKRPARWLVCGGGRRNRHMMAWLAARLKTDVEPVEVIGLDGDMLEAQAFAYLAVRILNGLPTSFPGTTGAPLPVCGGQISGGQPA